MIPATISLNFSKQAAIITLVSSPSNRPCDGDRIPRVAMLISIENGTPLLDWVFVSSRLRSLSVPSQLRFKPAWLWREKI